MILLLAAAAVAQDASILMVGNSYTARNELSEMVGDMLEQGVPDWQVVDRNAITAGGKTLSQHERDADGTNGDQVPLRVALLDTGRWDFITVQEQSQTPGFPQTDPLWLASRDAAVVLDDLIEDAGGTTVFFLTWGRRSGDGQNQTLYPDFLTMQDRLTEGYLAYLEATGTPQRPTYAAPAGHAFRTVYEDIAATGADPVVDGTDFWRLYSNDGSHPSVSGSYLAAATFFATLTGREPVVLADLEAQGLDAASQEALIDAAVRTVLDDPLGELPYPWVFAWSDWPVDVLAIGASDARPLVWLDGPADEGTVHVDDGRLWLQKDAVLSADSLVLNGGELVLRGALDVGELDDVNGRFDWRKGSLKADSVSGRLVIPDEGLLEIADLTVVDGTVGGTGLIRWTGTLKGQEQTILEAETIDPAALTIEVPEGLEYSVATRTISVFDPDSRSHPEGDCGCSHGTPAGPWLALPLLLWFRRDD